jgi:hypothetical protein
MNLNTVSRYELREAFAFTESILKFVATIDMVGNDRLDIIAEDMEAFLLELHGNDNDYMPEKCAILRAIILTCKKISRECHHDTEAETKIS